MTRPAAEPSRLDRLPSWLLGLASARAQRLLTKRLAAVHARGYHYRLLVALDEGGPASQATLGRRTGIDRSDVVAALNDLTVRGSIARSPDPADRRQNVVVMTPAGAAHLRDLEQVLADVQDDLVAPLTPAERNQLMALLTRVVDAGR